jgi:hypothetical protein
MPAGVAVEAHSSSSVCTKGLATRKPIVDHVCYTISNWNDASVNAALKAQGQNPTGRSGSVNVYDPFNVQVQLA